MTPITAFWCFPATTAALFMQTAATCLSLLPAITRSPATAVRADGKSNNTLDPQGTATRAEVAKMLLNFNQIFAEQQ